MTIQLPAGTNSDDWIIGNMQHAGWYRVNYDEQNWNLLIKQLNENHLMLDSNARAQLLDDSFNLGRAELIEQTIFLDITKYLSKEKSPLAFIPAFNALGTMSTQIASTYETFEMFKVEVLTRKYRSFFF